VGAIGRGDRGLIGKPQKCMAAATKVE